MALGGLTATGLAYFGVRPLWPDTPVTFAEAAALRDRATVLVLLESGADPQRTSRIRAGLVSAHELHLTPMEAAIYEDRAEIAALLVRSGKTNPDAHVCRWLELAASRDAQDVAAYLRTSFPSAVGACEAGASAEAGRSLGSRQGT